MHADPSRADPIRRDLLLLGVLALAIRLPTFFAPRHLTFDDGVFGASAVALRHGGMPFREVFSSQGPLFLPLVWLADLIGLHTLNGPRLLGLASGVGLVVAVYLTARELVPPAAGPWPARLAGGLAAVAGSSVAVTGPIAADGPAMAMATTAVLLALRYRRRPSTGLAVAMGAVLGAAIMVKALVLTAALPVGLILLWRRRYRHWIAAVGTSVVVGLGLSLLWGFADVWDQYVVYHLDAPGSSSVPSNLWKVVDTFITRDLVLVAAGLVVAVVAVARRRSARADDTGPGRGEPTAPSPPTALLLWGWFAATVVLLVVEHPLWRPHVSQLVAPGALLVAWYRPPWKPVVGAAAVATAVVVATYTGPELLWRGDYRGDEAVVVEALRDLPDGALAISDEPGQVWRAGKRTPHDLVDASELRTRSGRITAEGLAAEAAAPEVCAVVVWSERYGDFQPELETLLATEGYEEAERFGEVRVLYLRPPCTP